MKIFASSHLKILLRTRRLLGVGRNFKTTTVRCDGEELLDLSGILDGKLLREVNRKRNEDRPTDDEAIARWFTG